jgi:hypothetical protein
VFEPGCARYQESFRAVRHLAEQAGLTCELVKLDSITRMMALGLMATLVVAVAGQVKPRVALRAPRRSRSGSPRPAQSSSFDVGYWR